LSVQNNLIPEFAMWSRNMVKLLLVTFYGGSTGEVNYTRESCENGACPSFVQMKNQMRTLKMESGHRETLEKRRSHTDAVIKMGWGRRRRRRSGGAAPSPAPAMPPPLPPATTATPPKPPPPDVEKEWLEGESETKVYPLEPTPAPCPPEAVAPVDLVFLVLSSKWAWRQHAGYEACKNFVYKVVDGLQLGSGTNDTRVAVVQYHWVQHTEISLDQGTSEQAVVKAVKNMTLLGYWRYTKQAIDYAYSTLSLQGRSNAAKLVAVIYDGKSNWKPDYASSNIYPGVQFVAVGVGDLDDNQKLELEKVAGDIGTVLKVDEYAKMITIVKSQCSKEKQIELRAPTPVVGNLPGGKSDAYEKFKTSYR